MSLCAAKITYLLVCGYVCLRALIKDNRMDMACSTNESIIFACRRKLVNYELERMEENLHYVDHNWRMPVNYKIETKGSLPV